MQTDTEYRTSAPPPTGGATDDSRGKRVWLLTAVTLVVLLVVAGLAAVNGESEVTLVVGGVAVLWALFGILTLAAGAIDARSGIGHAFVSCLVAVFVVPAVAGTLVVVAGAQEVSESFDDVGSVFEETGNSAYDECMADLDTTFEECAELD